MATESGFLQFVRDQMAIDAQNLPDAAPAIAFCYALAIEIVNPAILTVSPLMYDQAVYNLAADNLINFAPDYGDSSFFFDLRKKWSIGNFAAGVVQSTTDNSTSTALLVQDAAKGFKLADLQNLKTPYGRQYLYIAQRTSTLWGIS